MPHTARPMSGFSLEGAQPCQKMMPSVQSLGWKQHISRNCRQTSHEATVLEGWGDTLSYIPFIGIQRANAPFSIAAGNLWWEERIKHQLNADSTTFLIIYWGWTHIFFFLNCECFYVQPRIQRNFTATSQLAGPIFPSIHRTAVRYSCKVTTVKILRYSQKSWDAALCCSDFIVKSHMPSLCLQSATVFFFKHQGKRMPALATQVCHVLNIKLTDRTRDWDSALLELQDSP